MTKEVFVIIDGKQLNIEEEQPVTVSVPGIYHNRNGKHYIQYEEVPEGEDHTYKNTIKISDNRVDLIKKGFQETQMNFDRKDVTDTIYQTPYGGLHLQIHTTELVVEESEKEIKVLLLYQLYSNGGHLSDNKITIRICSDIN